MRGQVSAPSSLPRFVRAGRTGLRPAGTSGRTVRSGPALDGRGPAGPDRTSGPVRVRPDASGVRSFPTQKPSYCIKGFLTKNGKKWVSDRIFRRLASRLNMLQIGSNFYQLLVIIIVTND